MGTCSSNQKNASNSFRSGSRQDDQENIPGGTLLIPGIEFPKSDKEILESSHLRNIPFSALQEATNNFYSSSEVSEGTSGCIFKGVIENQSLTAASDSGMAEVILVKQFQDSSFFTRKEFLTGIKYLSRLDHPNLVKLVGYCLDESDHMLLAFEFMAHGSLENHLFKRKLSSQPLSWNKRIKIALDAAKGLAYLHSSQVNVIIRDFQSSGILLDESYNAKLHGFELARNGPIGEESYVVTRVMGTYGYVAPEYVDTGLLTTKCDVYAFGVVLIEMLMSRRVRDVMSFTRGMNLADWMLPYVKKKRKLLRIMDVDIKGQYSISGAKQAANLAMKCVAADPRSRPNMTQVVGILEQLLLDMDTHIK